MSENLAKEELVDPVSPAFPKAVLVAGIMWIACGIIVFLIAALFFALPGPGRYYMSWGLVLGAASIFLGFSTVRGTTRAVFEFGIASIVLCILSLDLTILAPISVLESLEIEQ